MKNYNITPHIQITVTPKQLKFIREITQNSMAHPTEVDHAEEVTRKELFELATSVLRELSAYGIDAQHATTMNRVEDF